MNALERERWLNGITDPLRELENRLTEAWRIEDASDDPSESSLDWLSRALDLCEKARHELRRERKAREELVEALETIAAGEEDHPMLECEMGSLPYCNCVQRFAKEALSWKVE